MQAPDVLLLLRMASDNKNHANDDIFALQTTIDNLKAQKIEYQRAIAELYAAQERRESHLEALLRVVSGWISAVIRRL